MFLLLLRCLSITSWSSQFVQVFQEVYCYLYRLKEEIRKALQKWSISPKERALNEHSEGSRMAIWFSEDASHVVRFCVKKKKKKKLKLLTCVKLIVNIACDLLLVSFIPVLAVTLKVNKIDFKNVFTCTYKPLQFFIRWHRYDKQYIKSSKKIYIESKIQGTFHFPGSENVYFSVTYGTCMYSICMYCICSSIQ